MIAELKGKMSSKGLNLSDRLEDKLTGDFFGSLRYIPFNKVMKKVLERIRILGSDGLNISNIISNIDMEYWADKISFWPYDLLGEFDIVLEFKEIIIGIEVKLYSDLSSDDDIDKTVGNVEIQSINQLSRESRILKEKIIHDNKPALLILVAPESKCYPISKDVYERGLIESGVELGYLSWEEILEEMKEISLGEDLNDYEKLIINDIILLLKRKGLERFQRFDFKCKDVDNRLWYNFTYKLNMDIKFICNKMINCEGYYEFG